MKTGKTQTGETIAKINGSEAAIRYTGAPIKDENGKIKGALEFVLDIGEEKKAMDDAQTKVDYLDNIPTPVMVIDKEFNVQFMNPAGAQAVGQTPDEVKGKKCFSLFNTGHCNTADCQVKKAMEQNGVFTNDTVAKLPSGDLPIRYTGTPLKDENGNVIGGLEYVLDISKEMNITEEINHLSDAALNGKLDVRADVKKFDGNYQKIVGGVNDTLDAIIAPLNVAAEYVDRISKGDIPEEITDEYKGDFNEIKNNLNQCVSVMNKLLQETGKLNKAAAEGQLDTRAEAEQFAGGWKELVAGVNTTLDNVIAPLNVAAEYVDRISKGDIPEEITDEYKGDFNEIKNNLNQLTHSLSSLLQEMNTMSEQHNAGEIDWQVPVEKFEGAYSTMADGLNKMVFGHIAVKKKAMACVEQFGKGNFDAELEKFPGKKAFINEIIEAVRDNLKAVTLEINSLIQATKDGKLETRGQEDKYEGDWSKIIGDINQLIQAFVDPINVTSDYLNKISDGDMPEKITDEYKGDFNVIKNNLNDLIDALNLITENAQRIAEGDLNVSVAKRSENDKLMEALDEMIKGLKDISLKAQAISQGDLTVEIKKRSEKDEVMEALAEMVRKLNDVVGTVISGAENISSASQEMSSNSQQVSQGASEQASSAEEVSSSMEEMASNIQQNTDNAQQTEKIAAKAAEDITEGSSNVNETVEAMKKIAEKVSIIGDIATQTNMLALNAAVEAARAGEHGKGFAVVASEVRKLAEKSQTAAGEIDTLTNSSVDIAEKSGELLKKIVPDIQKTSKLVQEITAASNEQNNGAEQINNAINQLNEVTQQNASASEEMATSSEELSSQADQLLDITSFFKMNGNGLRNNSRQRKQLQKEAPKVAQIQNQGKQQHAYAGQFAQAGGNGNSGNGGKVNPNADKNKGIDISLGDAKAGKNQSANKNDEYEKF
jgi:methyl-accepting chemotaxis protein